MNRNLQMKIQGLFRMALPATLLLVGCSHQPMVPTMTLSGIIVPAYFYPEGDGLELWAELDTAALQLQNRLTVVANPANGPGAEVDSSYTAVLARLKNAGGQVLGYVHTCWGATSESEKEGDCWRSEEDVERDVERWYANYAIDGIFLDEASTRQEKARYYQRLYDIIQRKQPGAMVVNNFGTVPHADYLKIGGSILCVFENRTDFSTWQHRQSWISAGDANRFLALIYESASRSNWQTLVRHSRNQNVGWIYLTDSGAGNPWDRLPSFWDDLVQFVKETSTH